jgi:hypothetical protein
MVIHLFVSETIVAAAMYTRIKQGGRVSNQRCPYPALFAQVSFLSQLFRGEFVFPTEGIIRNLDVTLQSLEAERVVNIVYKDPSTKKAIDYVELSDEERQRGRENYDFYCFLIWPFIESTWLAGVFILGLTPPKGHEDVWVGVREAQDMAQLVRSSLPFPEHPSDRNLQAGKTFYHQGDLSYFEAVNKETLKNAFQRFQEDGIILTRKSKTGKSPPVLKVSPEWTPRRDPHNGGVIPGGRLWDYVESIAISRREGKNRRDSASVGTRVLTLVDKLGAELFQDAVAREQEQVVEEEFEVKGGRQKKRAAKL